MECCLQYFDRLCIRRGEQCGALHGNAFAVGRVQRGGFADKELSMFSEKVKAALTDAGWYEGRTVNIEQYKKALEKEGYQVPQQLQFFLTEFGGLRLKIPHFTDITPALLKQYPMLKKYNLAYEILHFDVMEAIGMPSERPMKKEDIFEPRIGEEMILFGEIFDGRYLLHMTPSGRIYARDGESVLFLGDNYVEMLENIFQRKRFREIP